MFRAICEFAQSADWHAFCGSSVCTTQSADCAILIGLSADCAIIIVQTVEPQIPP